ncbi:MAG: DUF2726 domain-containing protein [Oscillospiraceae bacterium]|nr:DUF2726 domain-containing protein [Oscillospiraceae bacterium]
MDIVSIVIGLLVIICPIVGITIAIMIAINHKPSINQQVPVNPRHVNSISPQSYEQAYEREYLLSLNEKNQYWKLRQWADSRKMIVFTKVPLLDLISPRRTQSNYNTLLWKIQAKHVDFVICDENINVKCVVEVMDSSHNQPDRIERDRFVRGVLEACGYKVVQTYNVNPDVLDRICGFYKEIRHDGETVAADETGRTYRS